MDLKMVALLLTAMGHHELSLATDEYSQCCSSRLAECCQYRTPDCLDYRDSGETRSGVYRVKAPDMHTGYDVYCDMEKDGGGWMVFQRRKDGSLDFYRDWDDYMAGFGNVSHEHWLGFIPLKKLMYSGDYELRIELEDWQNVITFAKYSIFSIDFNDNFRLRVLGYNGTAGDRFAEDHIHTDITSWNIEKLQQKYRIETDFQSTDFSVRASEDLSRLLKYDQGRLRMSRLGCFKGDAMKYHNGIKFSTYNRNAKECAKGRRGAWWYFKCAEANLNGQYHDKETKYGMYWKKWPQNRPKITFYPLKRTEMKIRRI